MKSMKSSKVKPAVSTSVNREEECGIWLDTKELKEKKLVKKQNRPLSRFLNPLSRSGGYSLAVLNFTQTKIDMPVTRQSTISTFFSPKPRDCNPSAAHAGTSTSMHTDALTGTKRKHDMSLDTSIDSTIYTTDAHHDGDSEGLSAEDKEERFLHFIYGEDPEQEEPPEKRRFVAHYTDQNVLETQEYWNNDAEHSKQMIPETETFFDENLKGYKRATVKGSILTSRPLNLNSFITNKHHKLKASPMKRMGKENRRLTSPIKNTPPSPFKHLKLISSPAKCRLKEKYSFSPTKSGKEHETAGENLTALFTQDSEGFCVIAHRGQRLKISTRDDSSSSADLQSADYRSSPSEHQEESDVDADLLFTQDSEGNMVIKH